VAVVARPAHRPSVAIVTLGCARNEVDSEELAGRLSADGFALAADPAAADAVLVNTCGFVEAAKRESVAAVLGAAGGGARVLAVGCLAERYGRDLAAELDEADAVLSFDDYPDIGARVRAVLAGERPAAHRPTDRRRLLPVTPVRRAAAAPVPPAPRRRLAAGPVAAVKLATGCDRRCSFCAIPRFRGAFVSRPPEEIVAEARRLAGQGARELLLVSENTTSYGKDLGDLRLLERLLPRLAGELPGIRLRLSYLQPAELRPALVAAVAATPGVTAYFDLSFQHASARILRRMRRFGSTEAFLDLLAAIRAAAPAAGVRSNVIVGFPGEAEEDLAELEAFLSAARLDAIGVFGYSAEDGTEAAGLDGALPAAVVAERVSRVAALADELMAQRAEERVGSTVEVLVERVRGRSAYGRAAEQGPDDGQSRLRLPAGAGPVRVGDVVAGRVVGSAGVDLLVEVPPPGPLPGPRP